MVAREEMVTTPDGEMLTFIFHPEHDCPHPVVLYLMDAPSIRPALKDMASRLATAGYDVMLPYLFYRGGQFREFSMSDEDMHQRRELMGAVTPTSIIGDGEALLRVADADPNARHGKIGAVGFCMSGGWCDNDATAPALDAAGVVNTVDFLTEAEHGFAPAGPRYDRAASEPHWERVHSLLRRNL